MAAQQASTGGSGGDLAAVLAHALNMVTPAVLRGPDCQPDYHLLQQRPLHSSCTMLSVDVVGSISITD
jgi:hypothetical protein